MFVDITEDGGSWVERTESGAKVFSDCGGVAGGQKMPASQRAETVWPGGLLRAPERVVPGMLPVRLRLEPSSLVSRGVGTMKQAMQVQSVFMWEARERRQAGRRAWLPCFLRGIDDFLPLTHLPQPAVTTR